MVNRGRDDVAVNFKMFRGRGVKGKDDRRSNPFHEGFMA